MLFGKESGKEKGSVLVLGHISSTRPVSLQYISINHRSKIPNKVKKGGGEFDSKILNANKIK